MQIQGLNVHGMNVPSILDKGLKVQGQYEQTIKKNSTDDKDLFVKTAAHQAESDVKTLVEKGV